MILQSIQLHYLAQTQEECFRGQFLFFSCFSKIWNYPTYLHIKHIKALLFVTTLNGKNFIAKFDENGNVTINNQRYGPYIQGYESNSVSQEFLDISFEEDEEFYDYTKSHLPVVLKVLVNKSAINF